LLIATSIDHLDQSSSKIAGLTGSGVLVSSFLISGILSSSGIFTFGCSTTGSSDAISVSSYDGFKVPSFSYVFFNVAIS
jgi:hypothetical protein